MKFRTKLFAAITVMAIAFAACTNKPSETPDTDGKDSITSDTSNAAAADTVQVDTPADSAQSN